MNRAGSGGDARTPADREPEAARDPAAPDEAYALPADGLHRNGLPDPGGTLDADTLPRTVMPAARPLRPGRPPGRARSAMNRAGGGGDARTPADREPGAARDPAAPDEAYALPADGLHRNDLPDPGDTLDAETPLQIVMPARDRFVRDDRRGGPEVR